MDLAPRRHPGLSSSTERKKDPPTDDPYPTRLGRGKLAALVDRFQGPWELIRRLHKLSWLGGTGDRFRGGDTSRIRITRAW